MERGGEGRGDWCCEAISQASQLHCFQILYNYIYPRKYYGYQRGDNLSTFLR